MYICKKIRAEQIHELHAQHEYTDVSITCLHKYIHRCALKEQGTLQTFFTKNLK
jgi:hypothetical protein